MKIQVVSPQGGVIKTIELGPMNRTRTRPEPTTLVPRVVLRGGRVFGPQAGVLGALLASFQGSAARQRVLILPRRFRFSFFPSSFCRTDSGRAAL